MKRVKRVEAAIRSKYYAQVMQYQDSLSEDDFRELAIAAIAAMKAPPKDQGGQ